jgi:hypothetical protein
MCHWTSRFTGALARDKFGFELSCGAGVDGEHGAGDTAPLFAE